MLLSVASCRILASCTDLMQAIKVLVLSSKDLQRDIVESGRVSELFFVEKNDMKWHFIDVSAVFTGGRIYEGVLRQEFPMDGRSHFRLQGRGLGRHHVGVSNPDSEKIKFGGGSCGIVIKNLSGPMKSALFFPK